MISDTAFKNSSNVNNACTLIHLRDVYNCATWIAMNQLPSCQTAKPIIFLVLPSI